MTILKCKKCGKDIQVSRFLHNGCLDGYNAYWFWCICNPEETMALEDINITYEDVTNEYI